MTETVQPSQPEGLGARLRAVREERGLSLRELARRSGCSPSLLSQVERGLTAPSAGKMYAIANELAISVDYLFGTADAPVHAVHATPMPTEVLRHDERRVIDLASGVRWERLTPSHDELLELLEVVYEPGGGSTDDGTFVRHAGHEYLIVLSGSLEADVGFETHVLGAGDSIAFDPATPHRYRNPGPGMARCHSLIVHGGAGPRH